MNFQTYCKVDQLRLTYCTNNYKVIEKYVNTYIFGTISRNYDIQSIIDLRRSGRFLFWEILNIRQ